MINSNAIILGDCLIKSKYVRMQGPYLVINVTVAAPHSTLVHKTARRYTRSNQFLIVMSFPSISKPSVLRPAGIQKPNAST